MIDLACGGEPIVVRCKKWNVEWNGMWNGTWNGI